MNIMLDTNVIIDFIAVRQPWYQDVEQVWKRIRSGDDYGYVSASALTDVYYITRRILDRTQAIKTVQLCYSTLNICTIDQALIARAMTLNGKDFEDDIVIASAEREGLDAIITRNIEDFQHSSITTYTSSDWIALIAP